MNLEDVGGVGVCSGAVPVVETRRADGRWRDVMRVHVIEIG